MLTIKRLRNVLLTTCVLGVAAAGSSLVQAQTTERIRLAPDSKDNILAPAASYDEILKTFEREAKAAYAIAKQECQALSDAQERNQCLAKARLQYDQDLRYAQERAQMGH